ncbi:MAG: hypothetical protein WC651_01045 [Candidatus Gracilibacteria bacterium]|jgi:hypothetical protein
MSGKGLDKPAELEIPDDFKIVRVFLSEQQWLAEKDPIAFTGPEKRNLGVYLGASLDIRAHGSGREMIFTRSSASDPVSPKAIEILQTVASRGCEITFS